AQWSINATQTVTAAAQVTSVDVNDDMLVLGQGSSGIQIYQLPVSELVAGASLGAPLTNTVYRQGETLSLIPLDSRGVNAVRYLIEGKLAAVSSVAPFIANVQVPAELRNGQPFEITTEIETVWGDVISASPRRLILQGEGLPVNPFRLSLTVNSQFLPNPAELKGNVIGSTQAIQQVEFYYSANISGPYELVGKHFGPEYTIYRDYSLAENGHYVKARAVDVFGNTTESAPVALLRFTDPFRPTASISVDARLIGNNPAAGHPFTVKANVDDIGSGVQLALIKRDGLLVAAGFESGVVSYLESAPVAGQVIQYEVVVLDNSGNESLPQSSTITVAADNPPELFSANVPESIVEQRPFDMTISASDDLGIKAISVLWNGVTTSQSFEGNNTYITHKLSIPDPRSQRVVGGVTETVQITITDSLGQSVTANRTINIIEDLSPDASQLVINASANGFFGSYQAIELTGFENTDDTPFSDLTVILIDVTSGEEVEVKRPQFDSYISGRGINAQRVYTPRISSSLKAPNNSTHGDDFSFKVRLIDGLGQSSDSDVTTVSLTQLPNSIAFNSAGDSTLNLGQVTVGEALPLQVLVVDSAARPVTAQQVKWVIRVPGEQEFTQLGSSVTDAQGMAVFNMNTSRRSGVYQVRALLPAYPAVSPTPHNAEVLPGAAVTIQTSYVAPVEAGGVFTLQFQAVDAANNPVSFDDGTQLNVRIEEPNFHFGFAANVEAHE
ncbi:hypothetical protein ACFL2V_22100, partial [Pseudomonadota bacterium]